MLARILMPPGQVRLAISSCRRRLEAEGRELAATAHLQHPELVAAQASHQVGLACQVAQDQAELAQSIVAGGVPVLVVEPLEPVEVGDEQVGVDAVALGQGPLALDARRRTPVG